MRRFLLTTLLALTLSGLALALADSPKPAQPPQPPQATQSITCTGAPLAPWLDCFYESPSITLGSLEVTAGAYARIDPGGWDWARLPQTETAWHVISLAPYLTIAEYRPTYAWWVEARMPKLGHIPVLGITDPIRIGFTYRW